ncbi:hypothetical protein D3C87_527840 [compost metagenome]
MPQHLYFEVRQYLKWHHCNLWWLKWVHPEFHHSIFCYTRLDPDLTYRQRSAFQYQFRAPSLSKQIMMHLGWMDLRYSQSDFR